MTTLPKTPPSIVRFWAIGGNGPPNVIVQGDDAQLNLIVSPGAALRIVERRSPGLPGPVPASPPAFVSVNTVTVSTAACAGDAAQSASTPSVARIAYLIRARPACI